MDKDRQDTKAEREKAFAQELDSVLIRCMVLAKGQTMPLRFAHYLENDKIDGDNDKNKEGD